MPVDRREFFRALARVGGHVVEILIAASVEKALEPTLRSWLEESAESPAQVNPKLRQCFFPNDTSGHVALIQPLNHKNKTVEASSPAALLIQDAFTKTFGQGITHTRRDVLHARPDDGLMLVAGPASSREVCEFLSNGKEPVAPIFEISHQDESHVGAWQTTLHWAFYTPEDAPEDDVYHDGVRWKSRQHCIRRNGSSSPITAIPIPVSDGADVKIYTHDWLLISVVPRSSRGLQRVISFAGIHSPGTRAAARLLKRQACEIADKVTAKIGSEPYYQALLRVNLSRNANEAFPASVELCEAVALEVASKGGSLLH